MTKKRQKPIIHHIEVIAKSHLFTVEAVDLEFSNGVRRVFERMRPLGRDSVMIVPIVDNNLVLIEEYAVGVESYQIGFPKGLIDGDEAILMAANRELKEETGFGAKKMEILSKLTMSPAYFSGVMNIVVAEGLYQEKLQGDEPEPLIVRYWPVNDMMALLNKPGFDEARNVSALFLVREWLRKHERIIA